MLIGNAPTCTTSIAKSHRLVNMIDSRLRDELLDAVEEVHGVAIDLKLEQVVAEQPAKHRFVRTGREQAEDIGRRKGNVPELIDEERRPHRAEELGREREVVVLDPGHRAPGAPLRFVGHRVGETKIHRAVPLPELRAILEVLDEHVAERPERAVGESMVVAVDVRVVEPDAAQGVTGFARRDRNASGFVGHLSIRVSRSPRHPGSVRAAHRRIERRYEAARGLLDLHAVYAAKMLVRFTVGDEDELAVAEIVGEIGHGRFNGQQQACPITPGHARDWRRFARGLRLRSLSATIVTRAPTRIDFGGGWTDVPPYSDEMGGFVCNVAIARYATVTVTRGRHATHVHAADVTGDRAADRSIAAAAARRFQIDDIQIQLDSDFPIGAGLGGSSAAGVASVAALACVQGDAMAPAEIAELSRSIEIGDLGIPGGRQDHYAAAFGGALGLRFSPGKTEVTRDPARRRAARRDRATMLVVYTGKSRISGETINAVLGAYAAREPRVLRALERMRETAEEMAGALAARDLDALAGLVGEQWRSSAVTPSGDSDAAHRRHHRARDARRGGGRKSARRVRRWLRSRDRGARTRGRGARRDRRTRADSPVRHRRARSPAVPIAAGDAVALARALVRVDSRNPSLVPGAPGERAVAEVLAAVLTGWGFRVELHDALPGRPERRGANREAGWPHADVQRASRRRGRRGNDARALGRRGVGTIASMVAARPT